MNAREFQRRAKPWVLPLAMLCGLLFHPWLEAVAWVVPYLIFTMLTITFCRVRPRQFELSTMLWIMLAIQLAGSAVVFLVLRPFSLDVAQAIFICVLCPTATAAPVVTGMLGGSVPRVAAYSVLCNLAVALLAPLLFVWVGEGAAAMSFADEFKSVALQVAPLIVLPLALAFGLYFFAPKVHSAIGSVQGVSFYLWAVSLVVVVGRAVAFILDDCDSLGRRSGVCAAVCGRAQDRTQVRRCCVGRAGTGTEKHCACNMDGAHVSQSYSFDRAGGIYSVAEQH